MGDTPLAAAWRQSLIAACEPARRARRPALGLEAIEIDGRRIGVGERVELQSPFFRLVHLAKDASRRGPPVLVVPPLSGHFPALVRDLLAALLPGHDLRLVEWADARDVPAAAGAFGLEANIAAIIDCIGRLGRPAHVIALCQAAVPALAATSLMAAAQGARPPASLILMNGMVDARLSPTRIGRLAGRRPLDWFRHCALARVPPPYPGAGRAIYPAALQHGALLAHLMRHAATGGELSRKIMDDDGLDAAAHPFLEAYLSVMDLPAELFLDCVREMFHGHALARGRLTWRGAIVDPAAIHDTALMTIEGGLDDVSGPGQTRAAHLLCRNIARGRRAHHTEPGAGHFGTFHGALWRRAVRPRLEAFIRGMG